MKVRIVQKGWKGFTGSYGTAKFANGEADLPIVEARRLAANIKMVSVNEDGSDGEDVSFSAEIVRTRRLSAQVIKPRERGEDTPDEVVATTPAPAPHPDPAATPAPAKEPATITLTPASEDEEVLMIDDLPDEIEPAKEPAKIHTRAELEAIADKEGIAGLRVISDPLNVKATAIDALIEKILGAQANT